MKLITALALAGSLVALPAFAQQSAPPAATTPPAAQQTPAAQETPADAAPHLTKSGKPRAKDVRAQCRDEVKTQGLKGDERKKAVADCVVKARPDLAAAEECRQDPGLKSMDKDARKAAIKACIKGKKAGRS